MNTKELKQRHIKLSRKLTQLEATLESQTGQLSHRKTANKNSARQSDQKFKENRVKALAARQKRANKAIIQRTEKLIRQTQTKLNSIEQQLDKTLLRKLVKPFKNAWAKHTKS